MVKQHENSITLYIDSEDMKIQLTLTHDITTLGYCKIRIIINRRRKNNFIRLVWLWGKTVCAIHIRQQPQPVQVIQSIGMAQQKDPFPWWFKQQAHTNWRNGSYSWMKWMIFGDSGNLWLANIERNLPLQVTRRIE